MKLTCLALFVSSLALAQGKEPAAPAALNTGTNTGDITLASVGSTPAAAGASLVGQTLTLQPASATLPGVLTAGVQTIGGAKTFAALLAAAAANAAIQIERNGWIDLDGFYAGLCGMSGGGSCITSSSKNFAHYSGAFRTHSTNTGGFVDFPQGILINNKLAFSATVPTIGSGFGTSPSVTMGTATSFRVNVGTGGSATNGVITLPTVTNGYNCTCENITTRSTTVFSCRQTADSTTSVTIGNFNSSNAAAAWVASDIVKVDCTGL